MPENRSRRRPPRPGATARRVLVMFGGDWCGWCHKLHDLFAYDPAIRELLHEEYVLVMVDTKAPERRCAADECKGDLRAWLPVPGRARRRKARS